MDISGFLPYLQNASLLLGLSVVFEAVYLIPLRLRRVRSIAGGTLISLICLAIMTMPYQLEPGIIFDTRSILISVTALAFGVVPTLITAAVAIVYRVLSGGIGTVPGITVIVSCALIGLSWRRWVLPRVSGRRFFSVYLMGVTVHVTMLACMLLLPYPNNLEVIRAIALPVLIIYPITATLLSLLLMRQQETRRLQKKLKHSEERFRTLFDQAPLGYQAMDADGNLINVNQRWLEILGYTREEAVGRAFSEFVMPETLEDFRRKFAEFKARGAIQCDMAMRTKDGRQRFIHFEGKAGYDGEGRVIQTHCILQDITEQREAQENLRASEAKYSSYIMNAPDAIVIINQDGQIVEANAATMEITGYPKDTLLAMKIFDFCVPGGFADGQKIFQQLMFKNKASGIMEYVHGDGSRRWANISAVRLAEDRSLCFVTDISEHKWAEDKLVLSSTLDDLTGLRNRRFFDMEAERLNTGDRLPLSILIGDINGLKLINDSFGRAEGDRIIVETAKFIRGFCREDDVLARTGGDEFSILLPNTDHETALSILDNIQTACREYNETIANDSLHIHLALGISTRETMDDPFVDALKRAENSMNQRKLLEERSSHSSIIATIKATMREKSHETEAHEERIAQLARKVGVILGLSQIDLDYIELLAELHDIGKVGVSEQILNKPDRLTDEEWVEMRKHPEIGERIAMSTATLAPIANYILCHHERWDGMGYPQKLAGYDIPLLSRILSLVDAYDAMTQDRVYQKAMTHAMALAEIEKNAGTQFDPQLAQIFCEQVFQQDR